jgi:hypothetical protein
MFILFPVRKWDDTDYTDSLKHHEANYGMSNEDYWGHQMQPQDEGWFPMVGCDWSPFKHEV